MIYTYNGDSINARPPISTISVNKFSVVFKDDQNIQNVSFKCAIETKKFLNWLVKI
jgi:hypothetical protein